MRGTMSAAKRTSGHRLKTTVKGYGGHPVVNWRDLGREGHGREFANGSPFVRNGIFVQGMPIGASGTSKESGPGLPLERRDRLENPGLKRRHEFLDIAGLCATCNMMREGHDRLVARLKR